MNRAARVQNRVKIRRWAGDPRHRVVVAGQLRGDWQVITSENSKAYAFSQNIVNEMLAYGPENGPDRTGAGHKMRSLQCLRQGTKGTR